MSRFDYILHRADGVTTVELNSQVGTFRAVTSEKLTAVRQDVSSAELTLVSSEAFTVNVGDWIEAKGMRLYCMSTIDRYTCSEDNNREYQLTFYDPIYYLRQAVFYNTSESVSEGVYSYSRVDNAYPSVGTFEDFVKLCCYNCNSVQGVRMFKVGTVSESILTDIRVLTFSDYNCLAVLKQTCEEFETTWRVRINKDPDPDSLFIIDFGVEIEDFPVTLQVEKSQGLMSIEVTASDKDVFTQFVVKGGTDNLPSDYPHTNLQLDEDLGGTPPVYANSIIKLPELYARWGKSVKELVFEGIFPSRTGDVSAISEDILKFRDNGLIGVEWSPVGGTIHFVSGHLIGFTFNCEAFDPETGLITIESAQENNGFILPSETDSYYRIGIGDKYNIAGVSLPASYVSAAKTELKERALLVINGYWSQQRIESIIKIDPSIISVDIVPNMGFHIIHNALGIDKIIMAKQVVYDLSLNYPYDIESITVSDWATDDSRADTLHRRVALAQILAKKKQQKGDAGVSITGVDVEFAKNTNPITAPTTGWTTTAPSITDTEQLWTRTKTTYSSGNPTYSTPANITPKKGDTGAVGQGIDSVTEEYAISSSKTVQPPTGWSTTQPAWIQGQYIWSRVKVVYKNPAQTIYTGYAVSSEWEAVNDLEIGVRNYYTLSTLGCYSGCSIIAIINTTANAMQRTSKLRLIGDGSIKLIEKTYPAITSSGSVILVNSNPDGLVGNTINITPGKWQIYGKTSLDTITAKWKIGGEPEQTQDIAVVDGYFCYEIVSSVSAVLYLGLGQSPYSAPYQIWDVIVIKSDKQVDYIPPAGEGTSNNTNVEDPDIIDIIDSKLKTFKEQISGLITQSISAYTNRIKEVLTDDWNELVKKVEANKNAVTELGPGWIRTFLLNTPILITDIDDSGFRIDIRTVGDGGEQISRFMLYDPDSSVKAKIEMQGSGSEVYMNIENEEIGTSTDKDGFHVNDIDEYGNRTERVKLAKGEMFLSNENTGKEMLIGTDKIVFKQTADGETTELATLNIELIPRMIFAADWSGMTESQKKAIPLAYIYDLNNTITNIYRYGGYAIPGTNVTLYASGVTSTDSRWTDMNNALGDTPSIFAYCNKYNEEPRLYLAFDVSTLPSNAIITQFTIEAKVKGALGWITTNKIWGGVLWDGSEQWDWDIANNDTEQLRYTSRAGQFTKTQMTNMRALFRSDLNGNAAAGRQVLVYYAKLTLTYVTS